MMTPLKMICSRCGSDAVEAITPELHHCEKCGHLFRKIRAADRLWLLKPAWLVLSFAPSLAALILRKPDWDVLLVAAGVLCLVSAFGFLRGLIHSTIVYVITSLFLAVGLFGVNLVATVFVGCVTGFKGFQ